MSYTSLNYHLVFGTRKREPFLNQGIIAELGAYITGLVSNRKGVVYNIGGYTEHLHVLLRLPPTIAISDIVRAIKSNSSRWIKENHNIQAFAWQRRYWAYSVSVSRIPELTGYIAKQEAHHSTQSFEAELENYYGYSAEYLDEL